MSTRRLRTLISGSGIAGTAAAIFLHREGHELTVIDKAPSFQHLGYCLSLKYFGRWVMRELGLLEELERRQIPIERLRFLDEGGALIREYPGQLAARAVQGATFVNRADLHEVLSEAARKELSVRFGTTIRSVVQEGSEVGVTFSDGSNAAFDLVVVAEGLHSTTRALVWTEDGYRPFGVIYAAALTKPDGGIAPGTLEMYVGTGKTLMLIPFDATSLLVQSYFRGTLGEDGSSRHAKGLLRTAFAGYPAEVTRVIESLSTDDYVFYDNVGVMALPTLAKGRVVLLGDAGYCPTFLSGMGASLGLLGARALAQALRESPTDVEAALALFDGLIQPIAGHYQANARTNVRTLLSASRPKTKLRETIMRLAPPALLLGSFGKQFEIETELLREIMGADARPA